MSITFKLTNSDGNYASGEVDVLLDGVGRMVRLQDAAKLQDDIEKILFTEQNQFWDAFSTRIDDLIGTNLGIEEIKQTLAKRVTNSMVTLQMLQNDQRKYQNVTAGEIIASIDSILVTYLGEVSNDPQDVFTFRVVINVTNLLGATVTVGKNFNLGGGA